VLSGDVAADRGPVVVTVEYRVPALNQRPFLDAMTELRRQRRRDGAYQLGIYQDAAEARAFC